MSSHHHSSSSDSGDEASGSSLLNTMLEHMKGENSSKDNHSESAQSASLINSVLEHMNMESLHPPKKQSNRLFGREKQIHELLGGGHSADVLLWRKKHLSAGFITGATVIWVLFEWVGCHLVSLLSLLLLGTLVTLFAWSNAAAFLNRAPPPVPKVQLSDEVVLNVAKALRVEINRALAILHDIALGSDFKQFAKVAAGLWLLSMFGGWFHFLTLAYLAILAVHTLPVIYEKNEDTIDKYVQKALDELHKYYKKADAAFLSKIPRGPTKYKKTE